MAREDRERICFVFAFACVVGKNPKTAKLSPMADDAITRGGVGSLVSPLYICGSNANLLLRTRFAMMPASDINLYTIAGYHLFHSHARVLTFTDSTR